MNPRLALFPLSTSVNERGHLVIGGCDAVKLAHDFGTPLYIFDEAFLRQRCREFKAEFGREYPNPRVVYAGKAFLIKAMARLLKEEGIGLDVVSGGELGIAQAAGFPLDQIVFHGNNKSNEEITMGVEWGVGRFVVDNLLELEILDRVCGERSHKQKILPRLCPGVDPHTHKKITTGNIDSKFGFPREQAEDAVTKAMASPNLELAGLHFHIGSQLFETEPFLEAIDFTLNFAAEMKKKHGFELKELDCGGGFGISYTIDALAPPLATFAKALTSRIKDGCARLKLALPQLIIEPGRSIVGSAAVALYTVGAAKQIAGVRTYVPVDGGMGDNVRPAMYQAQYEAVLANHVNKPNTKTVSIAGKFCESGDILINDIMLPETHPGDILAIPDSGAYCIPMSSTTHSPG
ncbi:MAG: diaminopimelate decarboxylase [Candidatus Omnitrophica bacterium]|nr:diaminopimelate decarboxylase [Candidatus Omnitrophota bacterium]